MKERDLPRLIPVSVGIFLKDLGKEGVSLWMQKRQENGPLDGLWEFPGGKIEPGETPLEALVREIQEEISFDLSSRAGVGAGKKLFKLFPYQYQDRSIALYAFMIMANEKGSEGPSETLGKWFPLDFSRKSSLLQGTIPEINHQVIDELLEYLQRTDKEDLVSFLWTP